jgi:hypothetical protein
MHCVISFVTSNTAIRQICGLFFQPLRTFRSISQCTFCPEQTSKSCPFSPCILVDQIFSILRADILSLKSNHRCALYAPLFTSNEVIGYTALPGRPPVLHRMRHRVNCARPASKLAQVCLLPRKKKDISLVSNGLGPPNGKKPWHGCFESGQCNGPRAGARQNQSGHSLTCLLPSCPAPDNDALQNAPSAPLRHRNC